MRGKGLGKKAIELVLQNTKPFKIKAIHLEVVTANLDTYEFYGKIGFIDRSHHLLTKKI
jgi:GNAT superfamily N-acetyltransferase